MMRSAAVLVVSTALVSSGEPAFAADAPPAPSEIPVIESVTVSPHDVVLPGPNNHKAPVRIRMRVTDPNGVDSAFAGLFGPTAEAGRAFRLKHVSGSRRDGIWEGKGGLPADGTPGAWRIQGFAVDARQRSSDANNIYGSFTVRDATRFEQFTVKGSPTGVDLHAILRRWDGHAWVAAVTMPVDVDFRAAGASAWGTVELLHTDADGAIAASERSGVAGGTWRFSYPGDNLRAAATSPEGTLAPPTPTPTPASDAAPTASPRPTPTAEPTEESTPTPTPTVRPTPTVAPTARPTRHPVLPLTPNPTPAAAPPGLSRPRAGRGPRR